MIKRFKYHQNIGIGLFFALLITATIGLFLWPANASMPKKQLVAAAPVKQVFNIPTEVKIPLSNKLDVPYTSQAPYRQWGNDTYENGCEEASLLMVEKYWQKNTLNPDIATKEIKDMVDWQKANWGKHKDLTVMEVADFADRYYGSIYQNKIYNNPTEEELKNEISKGRPVILAVMSHSLGNPYFGPNDVYHMLTLIGYDEKGFIANEPGVNPGQGKDYRYTYEVLNRAMGAQANHLPGQGKVALVVYPK